MNTIQYTRTLFYYDGPQVFEARDAIGGHYIAVMVEPREGRDSFLVAGVEPDRLRQFRAGELDLRTLLLERSLAEWHLASPEGSQEALFALVPQTTPLADFPQLPKEGFLLHDRPSPETTLREARSRNNLVMEVTVEPPEAASEHRIHADTLAGVLSHFQRMVKHGLGAALRDLPETVRRGIDRLDAHLLDVVIPAAPGSFRVVLEAARSPDLLGSRELAWALHRIDEFFEHASDPQQTLTVVKAHRGHLAGAYLKLLRFLLENNTGLGYAWAEPAFEDTHAHAVSRRQAQPIVELLSGVANLGAETVVVVGRLTKADVLNRSWRITNEEGQFSGKVQDGGPSLAGLKIESQYRFTCLEEIEETQGGREMRTLYLTEHEPV